MMNTNRTDVHDSFLQLIRLGIGHRGGNYPKNVDWKSIEYLAERQGLLAIVLDGVEILPNNQRPSQEILLQWIGTTLQEYEQRYELYCKAISSLAGFYNRHGYKMMVLKGYACSLDWSKPEHRPCGDIDIWLYGKQSEADVIISKEKGIEIDRSHHHHTVFFWGDFMVENHYDFINIYRNRDNQKQENLLKKLCQEDSGFIELYGEKVYLASVKFQAFYLLRHMMGHFATSEITIRQVLDWAFFIEKHSKEVDWDWELSVLDEYHMRDFFNCINAICVDELGFDSRIFPYIQFSPIIKDRVVKEIITPEFAEEEPHLFIPRVIFKYRRWKSNGWKNDLCYKESMWSSFWHGVWNHLLKPKSI